MIYNLLLRGGIYIVITTVIFIFGFFTFNNIRNYFLQKEQTISANNTIEALISQKGKIEAISQQKEELKDDIRKSPVEDDAPNAPVLMRTLRDIERLRSN